MIFLKIKFIISVKYQREIVPSPPTALLFSRDAEYFIFIGNNNFSISSVFIIAEKI